MLALDRVVIASKFFMLMEEVFRDKPGGAARRYKAALVDPR